MISAVEMLRAIGDGDYADYTGKRVIVIGGGGQPIHDGQELAGERAQNLYSLDRKNTLRFSHENPAIIAAYEDYFGKPLSHKAHELLHTDHDTWKMPGDFLEETRVSLYNEPKNKGGVVWTQSMRL